MKSSILTLAGLAIVSLFSSCSIMKKSTNTKGQTVETETVNVSEVSTSDSPSGTSPFTGLLGDWAIVNIDGEQVNVNGEDHPKLTFESEENVPGVVRVIGFNGCNYINGAWKISNGTITPAGEFLTSLRSCPDAPYEQAVNSALHNVSGYTLVSPQELDLTSATGRSVMKLRKQSLEFLNGAWKVTVIEDRDIAANIRFVLDTSEGRIHGNAGCNLLNGTIVINYDKGSGIEFQNLATSRMTCPDIAEEQAFLLALEQVSTAVPGKNDDTAYLCNSAGQKIITLKRLSPEELTED